MTIPSKRLITQITNALISSDCSKKHYMFKTIKCIDGLDVTVDIYLLDKTISIGSYCSIKSNVMGIEGNIYFTRTFYGDANVAVKKPNLKVDKLWGTLREYIDEELGTTYIKSDGCSVCLEHTYTELRCKHLLCICCQNSMDNENSMFNCPVCRKPHFSFDDEYDSDE